MIEATLPSLLRCHLSCTWVSSKEVSITCIFISVYWASFHLLITKMFLRHKRHMLCSKKVSPLRESCRNLSSFSVPHLLGRTFILLPWTWGWRQWPAPPDEKTYSVVAILHGDGSHWSSWFGSLIMEPPAYKQDGQSPWMPSSLHLLFLGYSFCPMIKGKKTPIFLAALVWNVTFETYHWWRRWKLLAVCIS